MAFLVYFPLYQYVLLTVNVCTFKLFAYDRPSTHLGYTVHHSPSNVCGVDLTATWIHDVIARLSKETMHSSSLSCMYM